ncbi:MAG: hypothetical protein ACK58L_04255 [Planctomycetota bacterium]
MAAIVILSMVAFTMSDLFTAQQGTNFLMLGVMIGGIVCAFSGLTNGRWLQYGIAGAVLGGMMGWLLPGIISPTGEEVMTSRLGAFDNRRVSDLMQKRAVANQFLSVAFDKAFGAGIRQFMSPPQFGYFPQNLRDDMAFGELLRAEADELGIVVTDSMVSEFVNDATMKRLTAKDFAEARISLVTPAGTSVTEEELFDALRHEIKAQLAYRQLNPYFAAMPQSPDVYYAMFRRMKVTQRLNIVRLDVDSFVSGVADPTDGEVAAFFAEHQKNFPGMETPGSPGFQQPAKVKLAYAEVAYKDVESEVTPPTDAEVEEYYNSNKDKLYRKPVMPAEEPGSEQTPASDGSKPADSAAPTSPTAPQPDAPAPDAPKSEDPKPSETPAEPGKEEPNSDAPAEAPKAETTPEAPPGTEAPKEEPRADAGDQCLPFTQEPEPKSEPQPANDTPAAAEQVTESAKPAEDTTPTVPAEANAAAAVQQPAADGTKPEGKPGDATPPEFVIPTVEYFPLDEQLKGDIRDSILQERVRKAIDERMNGLSADLKALEKERSATRRKIVAGKPSIEAMDLYEQMRDENEKLVAGMKAAAETRKCKFVETKLINFEELAEGETYRVGAATDASAGAFGQDGASVAQQAANLFPQEISNDANLFQHRRAIRNRNDFNGNESHFVWWIVEFAEPHIPALSDEGIREQVVLEWKRQKARDLAKKRAETLVTLVKDDQARPEAERKGFQAVLEGQTITGSPETTAAAVRQTQTFSWIEQSMTPSMNFRQQRQLRPSSVTYADEAGGTVRGAGYEFMKTVFEELQNDQPGIATSDNLAIVYVVQPIERSSDEEVLRQQFMTEGKQLGTPAGSGVTDLAGEMIGSRIRSEWTQSIWDKYGVNRGSGN